MSHGETLLLALITLACATFALAWWSLLRRQSQLAALIEARTEELARARVALEDRRSKYDDVNWRDELTEITNRRHFEEVLDVEWRRAYRDGSVVSLIYLDVDRFAAFNALYGAEDGDHCLRQIAQCLQSELRRAGDLVARFEGGHFTVILPSVNGDGAAVVADRLRGSIEGLSIPFEAVPEGILTVSAGVASAVPRNYGMPETLIASARTALLRAEQEGANRVVRETSRGVHTAPLPTSQKTASA